MLVILLGSCIQCIGQEITSENHLINITSNDDYISVEESIILNINNLLEINFWIMDESSNIEIKINDNIIEDIETSENVYSCNITGLDLDINESLSIIITYRLDKSVEDTGFEKKINRDTDVINIKFDEKNIYSASDLKENTKFSVKLIKYEEETFSILTIVAIFLLVLLLIIFTAYFFKKQKITREKHATSVSEEYLQTKKTLLMQLLKEIEKSHRAKKISDDTYHKLKNHYKNEAVETMKQMEEIKSEIK